MRYCSGIMLALAIVLVGCGLAGCGGDEPADVAGEYTLALTNGPNDCGFENWEDGAQTTGVPLTVTQDGDTVSATVGGLAAIAVNAVLGSSTFIGDVSGHSLDLAIVGTNTFMVDSCAYTINAEVDALLDGDTLTGTIEYRPATTGDPACATLDGCGNRQDFNGTRPPN